MQSWHRIEALRSEFSKYPRLESALGPIKYLLLNLPLSELFSDVILSVKARSVKGNKYIHPKTKISNFIHYFGPKAVYTTIFTYTFIYDGTF